MTRLVLIFSGAGASEPDARQALADAGWRPFTPIEQPYGDGAPGCVFLAVEGELDDIPAALGAVEPVAGWFYRGGARLDHVTRAGSAV